MAMAENYHFGLGVKALEKPCAAFRILLLKGRTIRPLLQFFLRNRKLMLDLNLNIFEAQLERERQVQLSPVHVSPHAVYASNPFQIIEHCPRADVAGM